jgi:hypothetical protein
VGQPQHHAEAKVLGDAQAHRGRVDERAHVGDFTRQCALIKASIRDVAVEGVERAETEARIGRAQILLHLPDHAPARHDKGGVNLMHQIDALASIVRHNARKHGECVKPHRQIVKILAVPVRRFADANAARRPSTRSTSDTTHSASSRNRRSPRAAWRETSSTTPNASVHK